MSTPSVKLLPHQFEFVVDDKSPLIAIVAGYGAGKSIAFIHKALDLASKNIGYKGVLLEPTNSLVGLILQPALEEILADIGLPYTFRTRPVPTYTLHFEDGDFTLYLMSAENYVRHIGYQVAFFGVDEVDTIKPAIASKMYQKLQGRMREGKQFQAFMVSTPEGFGFLYDKFVRTPVEGSRLIKAKTSDNYHLPPEYIPTLLKSYPPELIEAYLNGEFVNLTQGAVYFAFNRRVNHTDLTIANFPKHFLHIGVDFNVNHMSGVTHVVDKDNLIAIDEFVDYKDTPSLISAIKERYRNHQAPIIIYPDSSGKNASANASTSSIVLLQQAFGQINVKFRAKNPPVKDRIASVNAMFSNAKGEHRYLINTNTCKEYAFRIESQVYTSNGEPDKANNVDHLPDAGGYCCYFLFPIQGHAVAKTL